MKVKQSPIQLLHIRKQMNRLENDPYLIHEIHEVQRHNIDYAITDFMCRSGYKQKEGCHWQ